MLSYVALTIPTPNVAVAAATVPRTDHARASGDGPVADGTG
jgi:hypothetical protein